MTIRMPLGIRPTVDFAFKKTFGDPNHRQPLISLLNAILALESPIVDVTIENPFNYQDFLEDKLSILDVKAKDATGSIFNIEMQLTVTAGLVKRVVFYGCELYAGQLSKGDDYHRLQPVYSICILDDLAWESGTAGHHRFRLVDTMNDRVLEQTLEIHVLELPRYNLQESDLATASEVERWLFWFRHAHEYDATALRRLFPEDAIRQAISIIEMISLKTEDKQMYDTREKAARDYQWLINGAREEGREEGRQEGIQEGIQEGREQGSLIGTIRVCQSILRIPESSNEELLAKPLRELQSMANELQATLRNRMG
jgi:predicted transposase/invertase (TIGR01784 family)